MYEVSNLHWALQISSEYFPSPSSRKITNKILHINSEDITRLPWFFLFRIAMSQHYIIKYNVNDNFMITNKFIYVHKEPIYVRHTLITYIVHRSTKWRPGNCRQAIKTPGLSKRQVRCSKEGTCTSHLPKRHPRNNG